ncbi:hypothetical protein ZWY2020_033915 [Hordeum vulgare]|nr:hypothetical protein ZWY2020_033915 [Hordeum vulgare]
MLDVREDKVTGEGEDEQCAFWDSFTRTSFERSQLKTFSAILHLVPDPLHLSRGNFMMMSSRFDEVDQFFHEQEEREAK